MNLKYFGAGILALFVIIGWNAWCIQRDDQLFRAYYKESARQEYCKSLKVSHPDCK